MALRNFAFDDYTNSWQRPSAMSAAASLGAFNAAPNTSAHNVIPDVIRSNWYRLSQSGLCESGFDTVLRAATSIKQRKPVTDSAIESLLDFWGEIVNLSAEPVFSSAPDGSLVAEWFSSPENSLVVMFDPEGSIHFSLFRDGMPLEGVRDKHASAQVVSLIGSEGTDPFTWSDA